MTHCPSEAGPGGSAACLVGNGAGGHGGVGLALRILGDVLTSVVVGRWDDLGAGERVGVCA